jgi:diguanylate cyclase (GGDEF)-like protein
MPLHETDHEVTIEISDAFPARPTEPACHACLIHIYPPGSALGTRYVLSSARMLLGRDAECDVHIGDLSVSRRHAYLQMDADGYSVIDLQSTNGTSVNKVAVRECRLKDGDDLRLGNCIFRFLASTNVEAQYHEELYQLSISDPLTHIPNRRFLLQSLERELLRSARYHRPLALVLFDVDHFKAVNDQFGHPGGDDALRQLADRALRGVRSIDLVARFGGEEFVVVMPETDLKAAMMVAERLRQSVAAEPFHIHTAGERQPITISVGVAVAEPGDTVDTLLQRADDALYEAKNGGRNKVVAQKSATQPVIPLAAAS